MQALHAPSQYPENVRKAISRMPPLATQIANRWMLGWPEAVRALLTENRFLPALQQQEHEERNALAKQQGMTHLAQHEILSELGLSLAPPPP